jgi:hypothetical protein
MKIRDFILSLVSWFILLVTVSCSDELGGERAPISSESNLHVLVPTVLSSRGTRTDDASGLPTYNATVDECQINDLTLYAFPTGNEGKLLVETLPAPLATMMADEGIATYQLNITPGKYHIYVVANMNKVLSGQTIQTEDSLKNIVLDYRPTSRTGMPVCTNIPMIYEPEKDAAGNLAETEIKAAGDKYTEVSANLKFTCVKVKLNLLFDPAAEGSSFNGKSYSIKDILAQKLSPRTTLSWNGAFSNSNVSPDYANGFESVVYATSSEASNKGSYYKAGDWTEDDANANVNDKDIITLVQGATPTAAPQDSAAKWLFQGTYYLPERYIANASQQSTLKVSGSVNGNIENNYTIKLGHRQNETSTEVPTFPRGTYYEIIGKIKSLGNMTLDCNVSVKDWTPREIDADFNHTTLWVSKTKASVTSTTTDSIDYESNVMLTEADFGCDEKVTTSSGEKDVIVLSKLDAVKNHRITFKINEDIKFSEYKGKYRGTAKVWIKAGNIKKYLDVEYDASPYFEVNPQEVTIYWRSDSTKVVQFKTNLGGLAFTGNASSTVGNSTIEASYDKLDTSEGTFKIKATSDPFTTTVHYLTVQPKESAEGFNFVKKIKVTVKPAVGNYRINFRAINDRIPYAGTSDPNKSNVTGNFLGVLTEGGNNNWNDGWFEERWTGDKNQPQTKNHCIYVYTQIGETENAITGKGWIYTEKWGGKDDSGWPGDYMEYDQTNTGWYYKDFSVNAVQKHTQHGATGDRKIKPGETLIMFSNNYNNSVGYSVHRCPQHLEPGIPLFDYEDCEGWIVYDPTSDPTWNIYDAMPTIENIKFTIYTKFQTYGWFKVYGVAHENNGKREQFTIFDKENNKSWSCTNAGNGWYETVITLKAVKGDHEKDIRIMKDNQISDDKSILLFNGNSYEKHNDTGYYDGSSWHAGKPSEVN